LGSVFHQKVIFLADLQRVVEPDDVAVHLFLVNIDFSEDKL
jgi:hypothetical protein